jgi:hypothetical protein
MHNGNGDDATESAPENVIERLICSPRRARVAGRNVVNPRRSTSAHRRIQSVFACTRPPQQWPGTQGTQDAMVMHGSRHATEVHFTSSTAAVERAQFMLKIERTLGQVSGSLFDTIVANEVGQATSLATRMLGDYRSATETVQTAFERARAEFSSYDGAESPRSWILGYVADEAVRRSNTGLTEQTGLSALTASNPLRQMRWTPRQHSITSGQNVDSPSSLPMCLG